MSKQRTAAIAGAGVSGLALAIMLRATGWRVIVYEQVDESRPVGSGLMLQPTGLAALERLKLRQSVEALGQPLTRLHGLTERGDTVFDLGYDALSHGYYALAIHRGALHATLWQGFERSGAELITSCAIAESRSLSCGKSCFTDQTGKTLHSADLLVDATGVSSPLKMKVANKRSRPFDFGAVWATVPDFKLSPACLSQRYIDARIMIGYMPLGVLAPGGAPLAAFFWSLKPADYSHWRDGFDKWQERVVAIWPAMAPVMEVLPSPDDLNLASYAHFTPNRLTSGRTVLIGDAAHSTSPQLGQGANQGLIDAVVLSDALSTNEIDEALRLYARHRRRHVHFYQLASALMTPFFQSDSRLLARIRDLSFHRMKHVGYLHREMVRTLAGLKTGVFSSATPDAIVNCLQTTPEPSEKR